MVEGELEIVNRRGLHARAAAKFVKLASTFTSQVTVIKDGNAVAGDSIMGLMMLAAERGSVIAVRVEGPDEDAALAALTALVSGGFEETE